MRLHALGVLVLTALALLGAAALGGDREAGPRPVAVAPAPAERTPLIGVVAGRRGPGDLVRLRPRTLRPASPPLRLRDHLWTTAWSPDRERLAVAVSGYDGSEIGRTRIQVVDVRHWRTAAMLKVSPATEVQWLVWSAQRRLIAVLGARGGAHEVAVIDPVSRRVVRWTRLTGTVLYDGVHPPRDGLAALLAPENGIGPAALALVSAGGQVRRVALEGVAAGFDVHGGEPAGRQRVPALAIDRAAGKSYVVEAGGPGVVEVDLASGEAERHEPGGRRTALEWLRDLVEPAAEAKVAEGPVRQAHVVGDGWLAVAGWEESLRAGLPHQEPAGLALVDTREWTAHVVDDQIGSFVPAGNALVVTDSGFGPRTGVVVLNLDGTTRFEALRWQPASAQAAGDLLYASPHEGRTHVVDLESGRELRVLPPGELPALIPEPVSRSGPPLR